MKKDFLIDNARNLYAILIHLYPQEHTQEYGQEMQIVFADQCRSALREKGIPGIMALWFRTLFDLFYTAFLEHATSPRASWGLMEPVSNQPLPWKGIFLVVLPGLVYLIGQIAQVSGENWYMRIYEWGGFLLMLPPLLVWVIKKRYPIWGLMPLGLCLKLLNGKSAMWLYEIFIAINSPQPPSLIHKQINLFFHGNFYQPSLLLLSVNLLLAALISGLAWQYFRLVQARWSFWLWLCVFIACYIVSASMNYQVAILDSLIIQSMDYRYMLAFSLHRSVFSSLIDLLAIFSGVLFLRRHSFYTILILLGYLLPDVLLGYNFNLDQFTPKDSGIAITASGLAIGYRALLAVIAPVWISRSKSLVNQKAAFLASFGLVLGVIVAVDLSYYRDTTLDIFLEYYRGYLENFLELGIKYLTLFSLAALAASIYQNTLALPTQPDEAAPAMAESASQAG